MNEIALSRQMANTGASRRRARKSSAFYGYSLTIVAVGIGWLARDAGIITPKNGTGYWLGIVGGSMMLLLLLYPVRKRVRLFRILGGTAQWFRAHMILGILGPLLVLYHSNFQLGSINSQVALYCMLLVAGSGVIGRHIYANIHRGLYGEKTNLRELRDDLSQSLEQSKGLAKVMPQLAAKLAALSAQVQGDVVTGSMGGFASLKWTFQQYFVWISLRSIAIRELRASAAVHPALARDYPRFRKASAKYIRNFIRLSGRVAQFTLYERLFSLWHVLHLPLFFMMVISSLVHVLAVHMY